MPKSFPQIILPINQMKEANDSIQIFTGSFILRTSHVEIKVDGNISFEWAGIKGVIFKGKVLNGSAQIFKTLDLQSFEFFINDD